MPDWYDEEVHTPNWLAILVVCLIVWAAMVWIVWIVAERWLS